MRVLLATFTTVLYCFQLTIIAALVLLLGSDNTDSIVWTPFYITLAVLAVAAFFLGVANIAKALSNFFAPAQKNPFTTIMVFKILLIPYFIVNFALCFLIVAGSLNPFLIVSVFITIPIMCFLTYCVLLVTSAYNLSRMFAMIVRREESLQTLIPHIIFHFIFLSDVVDSVIVRNKFRRKPEER